MELRIEGQSEFEVGVHITNSQNHKLQETKLLVSAEQLTFKTGAPVTKFGSVLVWEKSQRAFIKNQRY